MVFVELPTEEILKKTKELSEQAMHLMREAEKLWLMCRAKVKQTDENFKWAPPDLEKNLKMVLTN